MLFFSSPVNTLQILEGTVVPRSLQGEMSDTEKQIQRTFLRERFLRLLTSFAGQSADIILCNKNQVNAKFVISDVDVLQFQVSNLSTPIGVHSHAILRTTDIISLTFKQI